MASAKQGFYYLGICPFLSSENVFARTSLGLSVAEQTPPQIFEKISGLLAQQECPIIIPSHLWWRKDALELLEILKPFSHSIWIQSGPGFELNEKYPLIIMALEYGFGVQLVCQKRLSYRQEQSVKGLIGKRLQINFFVEEAGDPIGDLRFFCDQYLKLLSLTLTRYSFGLLVELSRAQPELAQISFFDFATQKILSYSETIEQTNYAKKTFSFRAEQIHLPLRFLLRSFMVSFSFIFFPKVEKFKILFDGLRDFSIQAYHFMKIKWSQIFWPTRSSFLETNAYIKAIPVRLFHLLERISIRIFWFFRHWTLETYGFARSVSVKIFWSANKLYWLIRAGFDAAYSLAINYPLWPLRKIFWMARFQYEKRILKHHEN